MRRIKLGTEMLYTRAVVAHTTHHQKEPGTAIYFIKETLMNRLRTGSHPYPGRVISRRERLIACRLSIQRVKDIGLIAAYREEQKAFWLLVRNSSHLSELTRPGLKYDVQTSRAVAKVESAKIGGAK